MKELLIRLCQKDNNDIEMVEVIDKTVDVLFENGNIIECPFHSWIEYFSSLLGGHAHLRKHYFKNSITKKSI